MYKLAIATALSVLTTAQEFSGDGTGYNLDHPNHGNCNFMHFPEAAKTNYVAVAPERFAKTKGCGKCVQVRCTDAKCKGATATETLYIVDQCPGCAKDDLDFSREVFMKLTNGIEPGRLEMTWSFVDCPHSSSIYMCKKDGSNPTWLAVQPADAITGVSSMKINDKPTTMVDSAFYYKLESSPGIDLSKVRFELTPDNGGEAVSLVLDMSKDGCVSSGKQFSRVGGPAPAPEPAPSSAKATTLAPTTPPTTTTAEVTTVTPSPTTTLSNTSEPTTSTPEVTTRTPEPILDIEITTISPSVSPEIVNTIGGTPSPSSDSIVITVKAQETEEGLDLGYYLLIATGCVGVAGAIAVIARIRRKQWEEKEYDINFDAAQSVVAARRTDDRMTSPLVDVRYARLVQTCRKFLARASTQATDNDIQKFLRCIQYELKTIQKNDALANSRFYDELISLETDFKALHTSNDDVHYIFPTLDQLRNRRQNAIAMKKKVANHKHDPMGAIISQMENEISNAWEDKQASLMDDEMMTFTTDDIVPDSKPSIHTIRDQLGLQASKERSNRTSLSAVKSIEKKEKLENEMSALSSRLKQTTHGMHQGLKEDSILLDQVASEAEANQLKLDEENRKLKVQLATRIGFFTTIYLILGLFVVFIGMYIFMKVWSTRHYPIF